MSFFNSLKGFGRNNKKNKIQTNNFQSQPPSSTLLYANSQNNSSTASLKRTQSPSKNSVSLNPVHDLSQSGLSDKPSSQQAMFLSEPFVRTALVKGSFKTIVQLPKYVDFGEWIALNIFEFFTNLNQFYGVIAEYVTPDAYPTMNAGPYTEYLWLDANNRQVALPAGQYIDLALTWINNKITDQSLFPTSNSVSFPSNFLRDVQRIMSQMFKIFAHIYHQHFDKILHLSLEAHWNSCFAHFVSFAKEFDLIDRKEMYPLEPLINELEKQDKII